MTKEDSKRGGLTKRVQISVYGLEWTDGGYLVQHVGSMGDAGPSAQPPIGWAPSLNSGSSVQGKRREKDVEHETKDSSSVAANVQFI